MNKALVIKDLDMNKELDRAALVKILGGYSANHSSSWQQSFAGQKLNSAWKRNFATGGYFKSWT